MKIYSTRAFSTSSLMQQNERAEIGISNGWITFRLLANPTSEISSSWRFAGWIWIGEWVSERFCFLGWFLKRNEVILSVSSKKSLYIRSLWTPKNTTSPLVNIAIFYFRFKRPDRECVLKKFDFNCSQVITESSSARSFEKRKASATDLRIPAATSESRH